MVLNPPELRGKIKFTGCFFFKFQLVINFGKSTKLRPDCIPKFPQFTVELKK